MSLRALHLSHIVLCAGQPGASAAAGMESDGTQDMDAMDFDDLDPTADTSISAAAVATPQPDDGVDRSGSYYEWQQLVKLIEAESSHIGKTAEIAKFIKHFNGDVYLVVKLLLPGEDKRVYHVKAKQIAKILASCLSVDPVRLIMLFL